MLHWKSLVFGAVATAALASTSTVAPAQISINIGAAPACPYRYYDYAPYNCAPYGYYGPDWFAGGVFIGAGPWFHGPHGFYGHVDNRFDPHYGYHGPFPDRGDHAFNHFRGNEARDGQGPSVTPAMILAANMPAALLAAVTLVAGTDNFWRVSDAERSAPC